MTLAVASIKAVAAVVQAPFSYHPSTILSTLPKMPRRPQGARTPTSLDELDPVKYDKDNRLTCVLFDFRFTKEIQILTRLRFSVFEAQR